MAFDKVAGVDETHAFPPEVRAKLAQADEFKAAYGTLMTSVSVKAANYTSAGNEIVPVDAARAARTVTLPATPTDGTRVTVKKVDNSANLVTIDAGAAYFNTSTIAKTITLELPNQAVNMQYDAAQTRWHVIAADLSMKQLRAQLDLLKTGDLSSDPTLLPFAGNSPWRLGIGQDATFAPSDDPRVVTMSALTGSQTTINSSTYSHPVARASDSDPLAAVTDSSHAAPPTINLPKGGTWNIRVPADALISGGTDKHMHVLDPNQRVLYEHIGATRVDSTHYTVGRRHAVDLQGSGLGPQNGVRAYGGSAVGGLIRTWEIDPTNPNYTGRIDHPIALALDMPKLYYSGTNPKQELDTDSYNADGFGRKLGYVWPATEQDYGSSTQYHGNIPMGSYWAIPPSVDLSTLGLVSTQGLQLAKAFQDYGAYVTDVTSGAAAVFLETQGPGDVPTTNWIIGIKGPSFNQLDLLKLFQALRIVTNNSPSTPNGAALGAARRGVGKKLINGPGTSTTTVTDNGLGGITA